MSQVNRIEKTEILFWNVDTQIDFMNPDGKLYAPGAENIKPVLAELTNFAQERRIQVVNTADYHYKESKELSDNPDFINTFPEHCMAGSLGANYINEVQPPEPFSEILWNKTYSGKELEQLAKSRNIIIRKDAFDVFEGNPYMEDILKILSPKKVFVYGVTTNVCVNYAALGLALRNKKVFVVADAIKELPNIPLPYREWDNAGIKRITSKELMAHILEKVS